MQEHAQETIIPRQVLEKAPRPAEVLVKVEVESRARGLVLGGWTVPAGKSTITIPKRDVERLNGLVEDRVHLLKKAQAHFDREVKKATEAGRRPDTLPYSLAMSFRTIAKDDADVDENDRDMRPLISFKVIGDSEFTREADGQAATKETMQTMIRELVTSLVPGLVKATVEAMQPTKRN